MNAWLQCPAGRYMTGVGTPGSAFNSNPKDIFDIYLDCSAPLNAECGGIPTRANMSLIGNLSCTHQLCQVTQNCNRGYKAIVGTSGSQLDCAANSVDFQWRGTQLVCQDVDECAQNCTVGQSSDPLGNQCNNCNQNAKCTNKLGELGGFSCDCRPGYHVYMSISVRLIYLHTSCT